MLINTTDPLWPRVSAAFNAVQGPTPKGLTADQFAQNAIMNFIISVVKKYEGDLVLQPPPTTVTTAQTKVATDFGGQVVQPA